MAEEEEEDPPPPVPEGYEIVPSASLVTITDFLMWSKTGRDACAWHTGVVTKTYPPGYTYRGKPFTHDAKLDGSRDVRGVNLTSEMEDTGLWVAIQRSNGTALVVAESEPVRVHRNGGRKRNRA